jgi:abequosyltransferase
MNSPLDVRPLFSICIPAYNRVQFLGPLLDSILGQGFSDFEIVICEDRSPQRNEIRSVVEKYAARPVRSTIRYIENERNLGYDGNIRRLVHESRGRYCFFMGNDDLMCPDALMKAAKAINSCPDVGFVLKGYAWFEGVPSNIRGEVRYVTSTKLLERGVKAVSFCFRRCGVIAGLIIQRDLADSFATSSFDGTLYYQMYIAGRVLLNANAVVVPDILVLCRGDQPPDFGNSEKEQTDFVPGRYTTHARLTMLKGMLRIARTIELEGGVKVYDLIVKDMSAHFYPYIQDQLTIPLREYWIYYRKNIQLGFGKTPYFHIYFILVRIMGRHRFENLTQRIRNRLGRTPALG